MKSFEYGTRVETSLPYEAAVQATVSALKEQGFGVLTEIDVKSTLKKKIGAEFKRYVILGACNPNLAHQALQSEESLGLLLPCNLIVYEEGDGSVVSALDPGMMATVTKNPELKAIADTADEAIRNALSRIETGETVQAVGMDG